MKRATGEGTIREKKKSAVKRTMVFVPGPALI